MSNLLNKKRSRSQSFESVGSKKFKNEESNELCIKALRLESSTKTVCSFCYKEITKSIKIICSTCKDVVYCLDCLVNQRGKEGATHRHDYHIGDKMEFPLFTDEWTVHEELLLLSLIERCGLDNWGDISEGLGTKAKRECEAHYYTFYYKDEQSYLPSEKEIILKLRDGSIISAKNEKNKEKETEVKVALPQGAIPEFTNAKDNKNNRSRSIVKNRNKRDQSEISSASEILGYWPKREEFDVEFLNDAELEIAELEFLEDDTESEKNLKLNVLKVYNLQLEEREKRKKFVIERNLLDVKRQMNYERKLSKDDREIYNCLKPFARFMDNSEFHELFEGLVIEKNIRQRLNQLKQYKKLGLKTYEDIEKFLEMDSKLKKEDKRNNTVFEACGLGSRMNRFLRFGGEEANGLDSNEREKSFIKNLGIPKSTYYDIKKKITKELLLEKDPKQSINRNVLSKYDMDRETADGIVDFIVEIHNSNNSI